MTSLVPGPSGVVYAVFDYLSKKSRKGEMCKIHVPETVLYINGQPLTWYYTDPTDGCFKRRDFLYLKSSMIFEKFAGKKAARQFLDEKAGKRTYSSGPVSTRSKNRTGRIVACSLVNVVRPETGQESTKMEFFDVPRLYNFIFERQEKNGFLQKFIHPKGYTNFIMRSHWTNRMFQVEKRVNMHNLWDRVPLYNRAATFDGPENMSVPMMVQNPPGMLSKIEGLTKKIISHVGIAAPIPVTIKQMTLNCVIDQEERYWLLWVSSIRSNEVDLDAEIFKSPLRAFEMNSAKPLEHQKKIKEKAAANKKNNLTGEPALVKDKFFTECVNCRETVDTQRTNAVTYEKMILAFERRMVSKDPKDTPYKENALELSRTRAKQRRFTTVPADYKNLKMIVPPALLVVEEDLYPMKYASLKGESEFLRNKVMVCDNCYMDLSKTMLVEHGEFSRPIDQPETGIKVPKLYLNRSKKSVGSQRPESARSMPVAADSSAPTLPDRPQTARPKLGGASQSVSPTKGRSGVYNVAHDDTSVPRPPSQGSRPKSAGGRAGRGVTNRQAGLKGSRASITGGTNAQGELMAATAQQRHIQEIRAARTLVPRLENAIAVTDPFLRAQLFTETYRQIVKDEKTSVPRFADSDDPLDENARKISFRELLLRSTAIQGISDSVLAHGVSPEVRTAILDIFSKLLIGTDQLHMRILGTLDELSPYNLGPELRQAVCIATSAHQIEVRDLSFLTEVDQIIQKKKQDFNDMHRHHSSNAEKEKCINDIFQLLNSKRKSLIVTESVARTVEDVDAIFEPWLEYLNKDVGAPTTEEKNVEEETENILKRGDEVIQNTRRINLDPKDAKQLYIEETKLLDLHKQLESEINNVVEAIGTMKQKKEEILMKKKNWASNPENVRAMEARERVKDFLDFSRNNITQHVKNYIRRLRQHMNRTSHEFIGCSGEFLEVYISHFRTLKDNLSRISVELKQLKHKQHALRSSGLDSVADALYDGMRQLQSVYLGAMRELKRVTKSCEEMESEFVDVMRSADDSLVSAYKAIVVPKFMEIIHSKEEILMVARLEISTKKTKRESDEPVGSAGAVILE